MKRFKIPYQWSYILLWVCLAVGFIVACFAGPWCIPVLAVGLIQNFLFYRCPHCKGGLWNYRGIPNHCPHCGGELFKFDE